MGVLQIVIWIIRLGRGPICDHFNCCKHCIKLKNTQIIRVRFKASVSHQNVIDIMTSRLSK